MMSHSRRPHRRRTLFLIAAALAVILIAALVLVVCLRTRLFGLDSLSSSVSSDDGLLRGANGSGAYYINENEDGIFYLENDLMCYCDYASQRSYVLCDRADCSHSDAECGAYLADAFGLCYTNEHLYAFVDNWSSGRYDLVEMDINGKNRRTIVSFDTGENEVGNYVLTDFRSSDIYYGYGRAYISLTYRLVKPADALSANGPCRKQMIAIDLDTGKQTPLLETEGSNDLFLGTYYEAINAESAVIVSMYAPDALAGDELYAAAEAGELDYLEDMRATLPAEVVPEHWDSLEEFYSSYAMYLVAPRTFTVYKYDFAADELTQVWSGVDGLEYDSNGLPFAWVDSLRCIGWYSGELIVSQWDYENEDRTAHTTIAQLDLDTGALTELFDIPSGALIMCSFGSVGR